MLRISEEDGHDETRVLRVEGHLGGPWVEELSRLCCESDGDERRLSIDLAGVTFVASDGIGLLARLHARGVRLEAASPFVSEQLRAATTISRGNP